MNALKINMRITSVYFIKGIWDHFFTFPHILIDFKLIIMSFCLFSSASDSAKKKIIIQRATADIIPQIIAVPKNQSERERDSDPIAGQITKEKPNTALLIQNILERSFLSVTSAIIAWATDIFPHVIPSNIRERKMISIGKSIYQNICVSGSIYAIHKTIQLTRVPAWVSIKTGFLPYLSESVHRRGAARNWNKL